MSVALDYKNSFEFYRRYLRSSVTAMLISLVLTLLLLTTIFYVMFTQSGDVGFYATNSAGQITKLQFMLEPNYSPIPLLKPDPPEEMMVREVSLYTKVYGNEVKNNFWSARNG